LEKLEPHISKIQSKLQELLKQYNSLKKLSVEQSETIAKLQQEKESQTKKIKALEEQQYILKSAAGELNQTEKKEFEKIINQYIREIDKCMALLNE